MRQKAIISFLIFSILSTANMANALFPEAKKPSIVIIDGIFKPSIDILKGRVIQEVCFFAAPTCPNKEKFMEGAGASTIDQYYLDRYSLEHGTMMASLSALTYKDSNLILIRIAGPDSDGVIRASNYSLIILAFKWVLANKEKYNINSVAISMSDTSELAPGENYCPNYPTVDKTVSELLKSDIPIFASAGNEGMRNAISWPACVSRVIGIGASSAVQGLERYSNYDKNRIDYLVLGTANAIGTDNKKYKIWGTSISAQRAAAYYTKFKFNNPQYRYYQVLNRLKQMKAKDSTGTILRITN